MYHCVHFFSKSSMKCFLPPRSINPKHSISCASWSLACASWSVVSSTIFRSCRRGGDRYITCLPASSKGTTTTPGQLPGLREITCWYQIINKGLVRKKKLALFYLFFCDRMMSDNCSTLPETKRVPQPVNGLEGKGLRFLVEVAFLKTGFCERCKDCFNRSLAAQRKCGCLHGVENHDVSIKIPSRLPRKWFPQKDLTTGN